MCIKLWYSKVYTDNVHTINISEYIHIENTLKFQFFLIDRIFRNVRVKFWLYNQAFMHDNGNTFNVQKNHKKSHCFYELFKKTLLESSVDWCCIIQYQKANELILITSKSGKQKDKYTMMPTKN